MKVKKIALILLSLVMALGIVACGKATDNKKTDDNGKGNTTVTATTAEIERKTADAIGKATDNKKTDDNGKGNTTVTATPAEIERKIADAIGKDNYLCDTEIEKDLLQNSFGLDLSKVDSYVAKQNSIASVNPDTVIVLKTKDGYAADAVKALNDNFAQIVSYIRQYPFGTAKVMNARLYRSGDYVIYVIAGASYDGEDSEAEAKLATSEYAKIDDAIKSVFGTLPKNSAVVPEDNGKSGGLIVPDDEDLEGASVVGG